MLTKFDIILSNEMTSGIARNAHADTQMLAKLTREREL